MLGWRNPTREALKEFRKKSDLYFRKIGSARISARSAMYVWKSMPKEEIIRHLTEIGLGDSLDRPVHEYSGGMKRRVAIVRAVCYPAQLLILDEPFKGLDEKLRLEVIDYIRKYTGGKTVICVTHDPDDAERFGGKNMEMEQISE